MKRQFWIVAILVLALVAAACSSDDSDDTTTTAAAAAEDGETTTTQEQVSQADLSYGVATHENPGDSSFWGVVKKGAEDAGNALGVSVNVQGSGEVVEQAQIVETFVSEGVDGIVVSLSNPEGMQDAVATAIDAGIPVITINSGVDVYQELGAITHVGQTEFVAGQGAGLRFNETGATKVLCVFHEEANLGLEERCDGLTDTFSGEVERFNVATTGTADIAGTSSSIQDKLTSDSSVDAVLSLNPDVAIAALDAINGAGSSATLGTFDLSPDVLSAIDAGEILFAIDQQQYLQGYLPVVFLYLFNTNANTVGGGLPVLTGPGIVDASNAATVMELADAGTR
jgi:simple sugar transport system substrate-binding protein